ncbi:hypothetical protein BGY98DRAFT_929738 [Russula aff. rugulosa BPL654]|nr:hypothetical protein BGY98DRAFT_929738 [Russula aff. rugulosa BPL654]
MVPALVVHLSGAVDERGKNNTGQAKMLWRSAFKRSVGKVYSTVPGILRNHCHHPGHAASSIFQLFLVDVSTASTISTSGPSDLLNLPILKLQSVSMGDKGIECPNDNFPQRHSEVPTGDASDLPPLNCSPQYTKKLALVPSVKDKSAIYTSCLTTNLVNVKNFEVSKWL